MFRDSARDHHLLGDGPHPAPQRGRHDPGDRQRALLQGNIGKPGAGPVPGARPLQRAGRPHHGDLGAAQAGVPRRAAATSSASSRRASTASTPSRRSRRCATAGPRSSSRWAATSSRPSPTPTSPRTRCASADLTVHVSTKLNRSHVVHGRTALILPGARAAPRRTAPAAASSGSPSRTRCRRCTPRRGRSRRRRPTCGPRSTSSARSPRPRSATRHGIPWARLPRPTTARSGGGSRASCRVRGVRREGRPARRLRAAAPAAGLARRSRPRRARRSSRSARSTCSRCPEGRLLLQTLRSHDQFNTTIYGLDDRYRGIKNGRRVVFVHPDDIAHLGFADGDHVDLVSEWHDGSERAADRRSGSSPTTSRAGAPRPTTRRPTRWSRSTPRPRAATPRPRSRSWSASRSRAAADGVIKPGSGAETGHKRRRTRPPVMSARQTASAS